MVKIHNCEACNYVTGDKTNFRHHKKSKKHTFNLEKQKLEEIRLN